MTFSLLLPSWLLKSLLWPIGWVLVWEGGGGGGRVLIRGNTAIGLYMITTWQLELEKNVNVYGGMQEPVKFRRNIRVIFVTSCQTPLKCSVRGP